MNGKRGVCYEGVAVEWRSGEVGGGVIFSFHDWKVALRMAICHTVGAVERWSQRVRTLWYSGFVGGSGNRLDTCKRYGLTKESLLLKFMMCFTFDVLQEFLSVLGVLVDDGSIEISRREGRTIREGFGVRIRSSHAPLWPTRGINFFGFNNFGGVFQLRVVNKPETLRRRSLDRSCCL